MPWPIPFPAKILTDKFGNGFSNIVMASARDYHNIAVKADGSVWMWGANDQGQCGEWHHEQRLLAACAGRRTRPACRVALERGCRRPAGLCEFDLVQHDRGVFCRGMFDKSSNRDSPPCLAKQHSGDATDQSGDRAHAQCARLLPAEILITESQPPRRQESQG